MKIKERRAGKNDNVRVPRIQAHRSLISKCNSRSNFPRKGMRLASFDSDRLVNDEGVLVRQAQEGDRSAFAVLVERYWEQLYRWLYHLGHNRHGAEDVAQETFLKAFASLESFQPGTNFRAWLFRIAYNTFLNERRGGSRSRQSFPDHFPSSAPGPAEQAMSRESLLLLARAVGRLPGDYRAAFLLRVEEGMSFRQVAEVLETSEETARWRVFKARQKLMAVLAPQLDQEKS